MIKQCYVIQTPCDPTILSNQATLTETCKQVTPLMCNQVPLQ